MLTNNDLKYNHHGLIPAIVVDASTKDVLTLAYMNRESLSISLSEGRTCFFSRSRQALWRKGETSGNVQHIRSIVADCDRDALVVMVDKEGPACHLGENSCFHNPLYIAEGAGEAFSAEGLYALLQGRKAERPEGSYTTYLFEKRGQDPQKGGRGVHRGHHRRQVRRPGGDHLRDRRPDVPRNGTDGRVRYLCGGHPQRAGLPPRD